MPRTGYGVYLPAISLERSLPVPLYQQLCGGIRRAILQGSLTRGLRLPSTRCLASELRVSRNIVVMAFEQLLAEGYVEATTGAGTFVTNTLPDDVLQVDTRLPNEETRLPPQGRKVKQLPKLTLASSDPKLRFAPFRPGLPALEGLPLDLWGRLLARRCRNASAEVAVHGEPAGLRRLRDAIVAYVGAARGVRCSADQVIIVNGSQQAIDLAARLLTDPGDVAVVEDPGYVGARSVLQLAGTKLLPIRVGREGLHVELLEQRRTKARLVYVTPSHQFPLGVVLSLTNRLQLLDWAARNDAWILEDDFDSEYRYDSKPIPALQGLDQNGRVIYIGTFSKVLFPSLRLGYIIVPEDLVDTFSAARWICDRCPPFVEQAALADFISEGHLARHIRRMRALYMERRSVLVESIREHLGELLETSDSGAGMHTVGWLPLGVDDARVAEEAARAGIHTIPVSAFAVRPLQRGGLLLGYAAFTPDLIKKGLRDLESVVRICLRTPYGGCRARTATAI